jgi:TPR repeat protein
MNKVFQIVVKPLLLVTSFGVSFSCAGSGSQATPSAEIQTRVQIAAASLSDAVVIDCQLPGRLIQIGGTRNYLTPGTLQRLSAVECRTRGGQYTVGDLAGGTFSLRRWLPVAEKGDPKAQPEAQYYVARIYANGMDGVSQDFGQAAMWYQRAADQKYAPAMQELGYLYEKGLGVPQDPLRAINLQRQASGLGDDLDYAWKLTAAKEEAARQSAALSQQLEDLNGQLAGLRLETGRIADQLQAANAKIAADRIALVRSRSVVKELQAKLADMPSVDAGKVKELQAQLAAKQAEVSEKEKALGETQNGMNEMQRRMSEQQAALQANLTQSQSANAQLTDLLASRQQDSTDLRARLAQSEQRLLRSQQELTDLRAEYRQAVDEVAAQKTLLDEARTKKGDGGAALLAAKQAEIDLEARRVQDLTTQLDDVRKQQAASSRGDAENTSLKAELARLQTQLTEQQAKLAVQQQQIANWSSKSESERLAMAQDMDAKVQARTAQLEQQQRRIASLEADAAMLRDEVARTREARESDMGEADRAKEALRAAQQKISDQREQLDELKTQFATERAQLASDRDKLNMALARSSADHEQEVNSLKADIQEKESILAARAQRISALEKQLTDRSAMMASNVVWRGPAAPSATPAAAGPKTGGTLIAPPSIDGDYYALVIGNSNYRYMGSLVTPGNDAKSVADLLEQRYGFKVKLLLDATAANIMMALHDYTRMLKDSDRLLVYYAGHGGSQDGPPEAAFWLGVDADPETREGYLSSEMIRGKIKEMQAKHILLVADSCFSSAITHPTTTTIGRSMNQKRFEIEWNRRARLVLTSGMDTPVVDSAGDRTHSLFAKYFIQILRQSDDVMSGMMLSHELSVRMHDEAQRLKVSQTPTYSSLNDAGHDYGDFYFLPATTTTVAALR